MPAPFKIGERVLCISDNFDPAACVDAGVTPPHKAIWPVKDRGYTISRIRSPSPGEQWPRGTVLGLVLAELPAPLGFDARSFEVLKERVYATTKKDERVTK